jgi:large subunit ribosomal protein L29
MQARELRLLTDEELQSRLDETRRESFNLRQDWFLGRLEDNNRLVAVRQDIARIKTIMRERELAKMIVEGGAQ